MNRKITAFCALVIGVLILSPLLSGCSGIFGPSVPEGKLPMPSEERAESSRSIKELRLAIERLQPTIGSYPAKVSEVTYEQWADAFLDAKANLVEAGESETSLWAMAELARQGHNMDVHNAWKLAEENIHKCLEKFPKSVICNFSAVDYYISVKVTSASTQQLGSSLAFLKKHFAPKVNENVEEKLILYFLYSGEPELALKQIERFLELFPKATSRAKALKLKSELLAQGQAE